MPQDSKNHLDETIEDFLIQEEKYRNTLRLLVDWLGDQKDHLTAVSTKMGSTSSYITSASLRWIAVNVFYAKDLPIFKEHIHEDSQLSINAVTVNYIQQREPDHRRQLPIALYLATRKFHKFGPLIIVAYQDWVYDPSSDNWGPDQKALIPSLNIKSVDSKMYLVDLDIAKTRYFALDGQHRLMAIKGLELLLNGRLEAKKNDGTTMPNKSVTSVEIEQYYIDNQHRLGLNINNFQGLLDETMGIEIIPAVLQGETILEAISRLRNIFVDINENAKRLEKGELTLLDENDGFRIVARTIITTHPLFTSRVNVKTSNVTKNSDDYTTLTTVVEICKEYLTSFEDFAKWSQPILEVKALGFLRPEDKEIDDALEKLRDYFDALTNIPSHKDMIQGTDLQELRSQDNRDNILFWPIAQVALAKAIAHLRTPDIGVPLPLEKIVDKITRYENKNQLKLTDVRTPWFGVLCDPITKNLRKHKHNQELCTRMLTYLFGGGVQDERRDELRKDFFNARVATAAEDNIDPKAYDGSGVLKTYDSDFHLPDPWQ